MSILSRTSQCAVFGVLAALVAPVVRADDWHMWGGSQSRNMVNMVEKNIPESWDIASGKNIKWVAQLGTQSFGNPVVAGGHVYVGTNNQFERNHKINGDKGVEACFNEADGKFLWQIVHDKLAAGRVNDWPMQGICSTCNVDGNRLYYVSSRCELVCADVAGDGDHNGKIIWKVDMIKDLGVFPHNMSASSPNIDGDLVFVVTGNGVDEAHITVPSPDAPSFIAVNKKTGEVVWDNVGPGKKILHGQWSSPSIGEIGGVKQVVFPGGDGQLYAFELKDGALGEKPIWTFQCNPEGTVYKLGGLGTRNELLATPVIYKDRVYIAMGQDPEHGEGPGHMYCIDATKRGDISKTGMIWKNDDVNRALSTCSIVDGVLYHCDLSGFFRAIDPETGHEFWKHDMGSKVWSSPYCVDGKVLMGDESGNVTVFKAGKEEKVLATMDMGSPIYTTPVAANGVLYITTREKLYAIAQGASSDPKKVN